MGFPNNLWVQRARAQRGISFGVLWSRMRSQTCMLYMTEKYIKYRSRPNKYTGRALPTKCLRFPLCSPKEIFHSHSLLIPVFRSRRYRNPPSWCRSWSLFKGETSSISLTVPSKGALPPGTPHIAPIHETLCWQSLFYCLSKSAVTEHLSRFPNGALYGERCPFPVPCLCCNTVPISYAILKLFVNYSHQTDTQKIIFAPPPYCLLFTFTNIKP